MYALAPERVFVLDRVYDDPRCVVRLERMLAALANQPEVVRITDDNLPEVVPQLRGLWPPSDELAGVPTSWRRSLLFTTMALGDRPDLRPLLARCPDGTALSDLNHIYGYLTTAIDQHPHQRDRIENCVCWPTYNFGTVAGCSHGCRYCGTGRGGQYLTIALNLEDYLEQIVGPVIAFNPWNRVHRMILDSADLITLEPEYGLFDLFSRLLARHQGRYGHFHTASANVDWLADLEHRDRLVGVWSTTCEAVARDFEPGTGLAIDRIEAARRVQAMGLPVRFKFKPVIPVRGWQDEYAWIIEQACKRTKPESIGFCLYIWHTWEAMSSTLDLELLDPDCVAAARDAAEELRGSRTGPFPHETRREIYRHLIREVRRWDADVPLYVSTETREMWADLRDELGQDPDAYVCACSSVALPGGGLGLSPALRYSTHHPTPV